MPTDLAFEFFARPDQLIELGFSAVYFVLAISSLRSGHRLHGFAYGAALMLAIASVACMGHRTS
nr:hypothetical protein [uncultured Rhodopila sp.]